MPNNYTISPSSSTRRKRKNRYLLLALMLFGLLTLTGCGPKSGVINSDTPGVFNHYVIYPMSELIQWLATLFSDNYGIAVMAMTLLIRLVLFPFMMRQYKSQHTMKAKMEKLKPHLKLLEDKYKDKKDPDSRTKKQQETMKLYQEHNVNPLAVGCLPMLIQMPILMGLYSAIRLTPELATHSFLWFKLGEPDMIMPILAAIVYFIQFKVQQKNTTVTAGPEGDKMRQMQALGYLSPILMGVFAFFAPAAIALYWVTGGTFLILQSYVLRRMMNRMDQRVEIVENAS